MKYLIDLRFAKVIEASSLTAALLKYEELLEKDLKVVGKNTPGMVKVSRLVSRHADVTENPKQINL